MLRVALVSGSLAAATPAGFELNINTLLGLVGGAAGLAATWNIVGLVLNKVIPSRSDKRSDVEASFTVLSETIKILASEKQADADAKARADGRIKELEADGETDYATVRLLREQNAEYERRIAEKDRHIATLTSELARYGAQVTFDGEGHLRIDSNRTHTGPISTVA